ncbi:MULTISPECIES: serine hydrolase domain-containing protein [Chryseobacterium]|uniref:serine hydrolase domain-containing protein n=1 Tax=Chryseobacterium TaxID=59732 RepID=UPI002358A926|nr:MULTISPECIES: serine hydrolase domain-containing protein [unclassified Chryseobacterium]MDC8104658.1 beta-lactamase family protein [Chryseobacterium sp. B21-037]MDQ1806198.1 serine hydrolase domain-containing protein [Chryseobacterium sp. CKR4-1]
MKKTFTTFLLLAINVVYSQISNVEKVIDSSVKNDNFNGAVLIAQNGRTELLSYKGLSNRHYNISFSDETRFHIFSLTKSFTAVLIMQLYERGKINLDAPIATYLPDYKGEAAKKASVRNLLTYSSGRFNKDISSPELIHEAYDNTIWNLDDFIKTFLSEKLIDKPGTKFSYNNGDYILLGKIIENIYGKSFEEVLKEQILVPLKMNNTGLLHHNDIIQNIDDGYSETDSDPFALHIPTNTYIDNFYTAGGIYSTPKDLLTFDQAVFNHVLLKKSTVDTMLTPYKELGDTAFSFWVYPKKFGNMTTLFVERQGEGYGHSANWVHLPEKNLTVIILSNTKNINYLNKMRERLISAYYGQ